MQIRGNYWIYTDSLFVGKHRLVNSYKLVIRRYTQIRKFEKKIRYQYKIN
jgi:hypothetical protein